MNSGATPRSEAIERSPSAPTSETTTPWTRRRPGRRARPRAPRAPRDELAGGVVAALREAAGVGAERRRPGRDVGRLAAGAGARSRANVVAGRERLVEPHDHVEHHVSESHDPALVQSSHGRRGQARTCALVRLGGLLGASAAIATARRRRDIARRRQRSPAPSRGARRVRVGAVLPGAPGRRRGRTGLKKCG